MLLKLLGLDKYLDKLMALAEARLDAVQAKAFAEMEETRDKALLMMKDALPEAAAAIAEATVKSVFEHTQIDEAANDVSGVLTGIIERLPFGIGR